MHCRTFNVEGLCVTLKFSFHKVQVKHPAPAHLQLSDQVQICAKLKGDTVGVVIV